MADTSELWVKAITKDGQEVWVDIAKTTDISNPVLKITVFEPKVVQDYFSTYMPKGAIIRHVDNQGGYVTIWAEVDNEGEIEELRQFRLYGTGHPHDDVQPHTFIGTVLINEFVWHIYEITTGWA